MSNKKYEALRLALEALEHEAEIGNDDAYRRERDAIREALAEQPALDEDQAHYKKVIDDVQALFEAKREEAAIWQAAYETEKGFREQEQPASKPLTKREVELLDGLIEVQLDHALRCDSIGNRTMAEKQKAWDMERVELLRKLKAAHAKEDT